MRGGTSLSIQIRIETSLPRVFAEARRLPVEVAAPAMRRALDRTMVTGRRAMADAIHAEYNLRKGEIRAKLNVAKPRVSSNGLEIEARLYATGRRAMNLVRFVVGDRTKNRRRGRHISIRVKRGGPKKVMRGAFLMPTGGKGGGMFLARRLGKARLPVEPLQVIDVPQMFNARRLNARVVRTIERALAERWDREARFYLARWQRRFG